VELTAATTVRRAPDEVYAYWRRLENLATFMAHVEAVHALDAGPDATRSHWRVRGPLGTTVEWDAEIVRDVPGEFLAWRSLEGADVDNSGSVRFVPAPGDRGTEVHVQLRYDAPGGKIGAAIARLFGEDPRQQLDDDLRRFKQVMETGEVVLSDGAPLGKRARGEFPQRPAQPVDDEEFAELAAEREGVNA
jgi:uncharacterized membrane protein